MWHTRTGDEFLCQVVDESIAVLLQICLEDDFIRANVPDEDEADVHDVQRELDVVLAACKGAPLELEQDVHQRRAEDGVGVVRARGGADSVDDELERSDAARGG